MSFSEQSSDGFQKMPPLLRRITGCLVGVAIGDAFGMPWELCSYDEIRELTDGKGVTGLQDIPVGKTRKIPDLRKVRLGETTDDWMLTRAVAESLIRCRELDLYDQALAHVAAYERSTIGWGGTTKDAIAELKLWFDSRGAQGRSPLEPAQFTTVTRGSGNGVLMKIAPLACMYSCQDVPIAFTRSPEYLNPLHLERMTHRDTNASGIVGFLMLCMGPSFASRLKPMPEALLTDFSILELRNVGILFEQEASEREEFPSAESVRRAFGTSSLARESGPFAVATMLRHQQDFRGGILEAINAGGDTDTNASIVGAMIGAQVGIEGIPPEWIEAVPDARVAIDVAERLYKTFARKNAQE